MLGVVAQPETDDITVRQLLVLLSLTEKPRTVRELSAEVMLSKPAVSRAADWLEELGFARRDKDPNDRRSVLLVLTTGGKVFLRRVEKLQSAAA